MNKKIIVIIVIVAIGFSFVLWFKNRQAAPEVTQANQAPVLSEQEKIQQQQMIQNMQMMQKYEEQKKRNSQ